MNIATIPQKLYVTIQYRGDVNNDDGGLLGFASPYTKDAAFKKRKYTQDNWAYGHGVDVNIDEDDGITVLGEGVRGGYGGSQKWDAAMLFIANCHPRIIDNSPTEGFQIGSAVRRYGWNGAGNVKWRIADPRGFELEISSENFASVLSCCDMKAGVIQGKCVWGRMGKDNILLPESSEPFKEAVKETVKLSTKVSLKEVQVGDTVEIISSNVPREDHVCEYLGKYWLLSPKRVTITTNPDGYRDYEIYTGKINFNEEQIEKYLIRGKSSRKIYALSSIKVSNVVEKIHVPLSRQEIAKQVSADIANGKEVISNESNIILISPTKVDSTKVKIELKPTDFNYVKGSEWPKTHSYYKKTYAILYKDCWYLPHIGYSYSQTSSRSVDTMSLVPATFDYPVSSVQLEQIRTEGPSHRYGLRYPARYEDKQIAEYDENELKFYNICVTYNDITGVVGSI